MKHRFIVALIILLVGISSYAYRFRAFIPQENPTGTGVIVCPGGSYFWLDKQGEGDEVAQWLGLGIVHLPCVSEKATFSRRL